MNDYGLAAQFAKQESGKPEKIHWADKASFQQCEMDTLLVLLFILDCKDCLLNILMLNYFMLFWYGGGGQKTYRKL